MWIINSREPAEIIGGDGFDVWNDAAKVVTISNKDVTDDYKHGAIVTLKILKNINVIQLF